MNKHPGVVRSVDRAIDVLEHVARSPAPMTLARLAHALRAPKSTTLNIVRTLVARRLLEFDPAAKSYRSGYLLAALASGNRHGIDLGSIAKPHLERLALETQEAVFLAVLEGNEIIFIEKVESSQPIRYIAQIGTRRPLHCTAGGKLCLALQTGARIEQYIREVGLPRYTANTITTPAALRKELEGIRQRGYSVSNGEFIEDLMGIAVPIVHPDSHEPVAAIVVAGPAFRLRKRARQVTAAMQRAATALADDVGRFGAATPSLT
jgi:DNA-binding IclR family transcriptional regulator